MIRYKLTDTQNILFFIFTYSRIYSEFSLNIRGAYDKFPDFFRMGI